MPEASWPEARRDGALFDPPHRGVSAVQPIQDETEHIAAYCDPCSACRANTSRTAR